MPKGIAEGLSPEKLRELARAGAEVALRRLRAEIIAIERTFRSLRCRSVGERCAGPSDRQRTARAGCRPRLVRLSPSG